MTIKQRLLLLVGAAILSLVALTAINHQQMNKVYDAANYANVNVVPSIETLNIIAVEFGRARVRVFRHIMATDPKEKEDAEKTIQETRAKIDKAFKDYEALVTNADDLRLGRGEQARDLGVHVVRCHALEQEVLDGRVEVGAELHVRGARVGQALNVLEVPLALAAEGCVCVERVEERRRDFHVVTPNIRYFRGTFQSQPLRRCTRSHPA